MAGTLLSAEGVSLNKTVEEMSINGHAPPPQFHVKEISDGSADSSPPVPIPVIDISLLSDEDELQKLRSALSSEGCFQV